MARKGKEGSFVFSSDSEEMRPFDGIVVNTDPRIEEQIKSKKDLKPGSEDDDIFGSKESLEGKGTEEDVYEGVDLFGKEDIVDEEEADPGEEAEAGAPEEEEVDEGEEEKEEGDAPENKTDEDKDSPEEEEVEEAGEVNLYKYMADQLKADGELPEDFEVTEKTTSADIFEAYVESIKEDASQYIKSQVYAELQNSGIDEQHLQYAKLLRQGIDPRMLSDASRYEQLSKIDIEKTEDDTKKEVIRQMYREKNLDDKAIGKLLEAAELDDELDSMAEEAKTHFKSKYDSIIEEQSNLAEKREEQRLAIAEKQQKIVNGVIKAGKVLGESIPDVKEFKKGLYDRDKTVEMGGKKYAASELELFLLDFQNNPETKLWAFKKWKFKDTEKDAIKEAAEEKAEKDLLNGYKNALEKSKSSDKNRKLKKNLDNKGIGTRKKDRKDGPIIFKI